MIRAALQRHAAPLYLGGLAAVPAGAALALWATSYGWTAAGFGVVALGLAAMGVTSRSVGV